MHTAADIENRLIAWMRGEADGFASFDKAAAAVLAHQYQHNTAYRRYWDSTGTPAPGAAGDWRTAPALPTDCFKESAHPPRGFAAEQVRHVFRTSGTTRELRGQHEFASLALYETSIREGWRQLGLPAIDNPWIVAPPARATPDSSLAHMFATLAAGFPETRWLIDTAGRLDALPLARQSTPVALFSTSIALFRLMDAHRPLPLPAGSWVFETGGPKGLSIALEPVDFQTRIAAFFAIPAGRVINEYSMTELSSQFYRWGGKPEHRGPHWTRVRVINPETNRPCALGEAGYLEIIDLANLGSVAAIRTQDLAIARGECAFDLLGRDPGAMPRGCSRAAEGVWKANTYGVPG